MSDLQTEWFSRRVPPREHRLHCEWCAAASGAGARGWLGRRVDDLESGEPTIAIVCPDCAEHEPA